MLKSNFSVYLRKTQTDKGHPYDLYHLVVSGFATKHYRQEIFVADLQRMGGGIRLEKWRVTSKANTVILSAYLEVSILGHDLDQWRHYDLETGQDITKELDDDLATVQQFGEKLHTLRKWRGITLQKLPSLLEAPSYRYISNVEKGHEKPTIDIVLKVAEIFDVSLDELLKDNFELRISNDK